MANDEIYVAARHLLLDGLTALRPHLPALTLVGAQAIYMRVGEADLAVAPSTTDADLAVDPAVLPDSPPLERLMADGGFRRKRGDDGAPLPGLWVRQGAAGQSSHVSVDLLVPEAVAAAAGRRAARLAGHETGSVLKVPGLEACLIDAETMAIRALESDDDRVFDLRVAGPAALLIAKLHKIADRTRTHGRLEDKDALDVFRLLRGTPPEEFQRRLGPLLADERSAASTQRGLGMLPTLFGKRDGAGVMMAIRAMERLMEPQEVSASLIAIARSAPFRVG